MDAVAKRDETSVAHARSRIQFEQPIGKFQGSQDRRNEMRLEAARPMTYRTAWPLGQPRISLDASRTKVFVNARWSAHLATRLDRRSTREARSSAMSLPFARSLIGVFFPMTAIGTF